MLIYVYNSTTCMQQQTGDSFRPHAIKPIIYNILCYYLDLLLTNLYWYILFKCHLTNDKIQHKIHKTSILHVLFQSGEAHFYTIQQKQSTSVGV